MQLSYIPPAPKLERLFQLSRELCFLSNLPCDIESDGFDWHSESCHPREVTEFQSVMSQTATMVRPVPPAMTAHHWNQLWPHVKGRVRPNAEQREMGQLETRKP